MMKVHSEDIPLGKRFEDGNYAMFVHWGLYSQLGNEVNGKTYYGIGEWIMNPQMANIHPEKYKEVAKQFNPVKFDPMAIARLAKDAGMKYVVITSKHHDGFAMYHSNSNDFNVVDATPYKRDVMKDLAKACHDVGIGFGFYYSHYQDWTYPGGNNGPTTDEEGKDATFDDYFKKKCLLQVEEITSEYGPIELVWFDTPGQISKHYVQELVKVVRKNQPNALISGRIGHGLGDYQSLDDMEVPVRNVEGMWEAVDTTNDSWGYAHYDENWKTPAQILHRLIACVARGGTYMLNIGPRGDGSIPEPAQNSLRNAGEWIKRYPQVVYGTDPSPWNHAMPWGDVVVKGNKMFLTVNTWPLSGELCLPGLKAPILSAMMLKGTESEPVKYENLGSWTRFMLPARAPERYVSVLELVLKGVPEVDDVHGIDPGMTTTIEVEFSIVTGGTKETKRWMEKFGEWKHAIQVSNWLSDTKVTWNVNVLEPGDYQIELTYAGDGRLVWGVELEGGSFIKNEKESSHIYQSFPIGWLKLDRSGFHSITVSLLEGDVSKASLKSISISP
eukprot:CAMPEP_0195529794 /NCGR_PEP_ID=MMETSP0794_2-20130614/32436_1 /TAXON_ID=515487 /ORGANISM="Stephanopyxis turris, Strain CCMP 815" /LENGTH=555 /DNA_ID=CAMNT_0040661153 /DNA_START=241 /DNA_END=1904 /DNA_ORIENTATION=+